MRRFLFSLVGLSLVFALAGCGTPPDRRLESPGLNVTALTRSTDDYIVTLRYLNPNAVPLAVGSASHVLYLGEERIGKFDDKNSVGVPPLGVALHSVMLPRALSKDVRDYLAGHAGEVQVVVQSSLEIVISGDDLLSLKASGSGKVTPK